MVDLKTTYMGIALKNPIMVGACSLSKQIDYIRQIEAAGAGALVIKSLFEEQIQLERGKLDDIRATYNERYAEAIELFPKTAHAGPKEHLMWVAQAKKLVSMPLIASLNATTDAVWVDYARKLVDTGVDGLELNFYSLPLDPSSNSTTLEKNELETFAQIRAAVKIPIAIKLHPYYTNLFHLITEFDRMGANAVVLFNRFYQPDIDLDKEEEKISLRLSSSRDSALTLRWTALLFDHIRADISSSSGIMTGADALKMLLAGARTVQVVSTLYKNKIPYLGQMIADMETWMKNKGYRSLDEIRGKVSKRRTKDPWGFERGQYIKALLGFD